MYVKQALKASSRNVDMRRFLMMCNLNVNSD